MEIKHKIIKDFQLLTEDKTIIILKAGTLIKNYKFESKSDIINIDKSIVDTNADYFQLLDWKIELLSVIKQNKIPQPAQVIKKLIPFIEESFILNQKQNIAQDIDTSTQLKEIKLKEHELEIKLEKLNKREKSIKEESELLDARETDLKAKLRQVREKEDSLIDVELDLKRKEREIERKSSEVVLDNTEANKEAAKIIENAKSEAYSILSDADSKIASLTKEHNKKVQEYEEVLKDYKEKIQDSIVDKIKETIIINLDRMKDNPNISTKGDMIKQIKIILNHL